MAEVAAIQIRFTQPYRVRCRSDVASNRRFSSRQWMRSETACKSFHLEGRTPHLEDRAP